MLSFLLIASYSRGQVTIAIQDFDGAIPTMTYTGGALATGNGLFPATPKYVSATNGRQVNNSTSNITFSTVNTTGYTSVNFTVNLASFAGTSGNGNDGADYAIVSVSTDGGTTWSQELQINGNNNAKWGFSGVNAGTGTASTPYDGNNTSTNFTPVGGGYRTADGYQFLSVTGLPATASLRIRMEFKNNSPNEYWVIDDAKITGIIACTGPTTQASFTSITAITSSSMTINFGAGTGGNGRIVIVSDAAISATPINGNTYTANTVYNFGTDIGINEFVVYDGTGTSVTVTGLTPGTTYYVEIFEYVTGGLSTPCYDASTSSNTGNSTTPCTIATEPTIAASNIAFSNVACVDMSISWTSGNGSNVIVIVSTSVITGTPTDQTAYTANSIFGSGSTINVGEFVVFNGAGTNVFITGLAASTTYYMKIFSYNGTTPNCAENYLISFSTSSSQLTLTTCTCPQIKSILVNSCGASSTEGLDEQVVFQTGSSALSINNLSITYPTAGSFCNTTCGINTNGNNAAFIAALNTTAGCTPSIFYYQDPIPANSRVIMLTGATPSIVINYSSLCGTGPYYVVFNNNSNTSGRFANAANANRTTLMNFNGSCSQSVTYNSSSVNTGTDGDYAYFDALGNVSYGNNALCVAGPLPVELTQFNGYGNNTSNFLNWSTASEINNDYFDIERSNDGYTFENIGMVYGNGTTTFQNHYSFIDETPFPSLNYYRLKQVDFNGNFEYSNTIAIKSEVAEFTIWQANDFLHISTSKEVKNIKHLNIYSALGQLIYSTSDSSLSLINTSRWEKGIYLVQIQTENSSFTKKIQFK